MDAAIEARLTLRHWGCIVSEGLTDGAQAAHVSSDRNADIVVMQGRTEEQVETFLENVRGTQDRPWDIVSRAPCSVILRVQTPEWGIYSAITRSNCGVLWPATWRDGLEKYTVFAPTRAHLDGLVRALREIADVTIEELTVVDPGNLQVSAPLASITLGLTDRQLKAFQAAAESGYYDTPRATSSEAIARKFGVSRTTFEGHLRKAESRVFPRVAALIAAHPGLVEAAKAGPGRPPKRLKRSAWDQDTSPSPENSDG